MEYCSILFERPEDRPRGGLETDSSALADLSIDQIVEALTLGREEYELDSVWVRRVTQGETVRYRQAVFRDLENPDTDAVLADFAQTMREVRSALALAQRIRHRPQREAWFLHAIERYWGAVAHLVSGLARAPLQSPAMLRVRDALRLHSEGEAFVVLGREAAEVRAQLNEVRYLVHLRGDRVIVRRAGAERDYEQEVRETFARFQQGEGKSRLFPQPDGFGMNSVEERILDLVVRLFPEPFAALGRLCSQHAAFVDPAIRELEREVQFYAAYWQYLRPLRAAGLPFCYPEVSPESKAERVDSTFDLALAARLVPQGHGIVLNGFELAGQERLLVVSGPNQGGKTTLARTFGQLHHLAALGCPVPGREAHLLLCDQLLTHFERAENLHDLRGRLEDDLTRVEEILHRATGRSVVILNETFGSASLLDAQQLGRAVVERLLALDLIGVYVTFIDELASLGPATVSMVSTVVPEDPARRTFLLVRRPADGLAYALALAEKHGLTYARVTERLVR